MLAIVMGALRHLQDSIELNGQRVALVIVHRRRHRRCR